MRITRTMTTAIVALLALAASGCVALTNAPAGGGSITTSSYTIGPFNLAATGQPGWESQTSQTNVPRPAGAFGIKTMTFDLVDQNGDPVPRHMVHLHHVLMMDNAHQDVLCPGREERFAGAGAERTPLNLRDPYAYLVGANDRWDSLWHLMNMDTMPQTVSIKYTIGYQKNATAANSRSVTPFFADVTGCGNSEFDVPGNGGMGSVFTKSRSWTAPWDGIMVYAGGHLHGGGIDLTLKDPSSGSQCVMTAHYDMPMSEMFATAADMGMIDPPTMIDPCPAHNAVFGGKTYSLTARYDNSQPYMGVMGIALAYVWRGHQ
jgi:hypothetical protein